MRSESFGWKESGVLILGCTQWSSSDFTQFSIMTEVTVDNFEDLFPQIANEISNCSFVSFQLHLTGQHLDQALHPTTDDSPKTRYRKLRQSVLSFLPCQFGLSIFRRRQHQNGFKCCVYTFYLFPRFYDCRQARVFSVHSAAAELLQAHGFDFGRMFSQGISFMNDEEEFQLRKRLRGTDVVALSTSESSAHLAKETTKSVSSSAPRIPSPPPLDAHEQILDDLIQQVVSWISSLSVEPIRIISSSASEAKFSPSSSVSTRLTYAPLPNELHNYLLIRHLRKYFPDLWVELDPVDECGLLVCRVSAQERLDLESDAFKFENEIILSHLVGFSRLFKTLVEVKKPIVGFEMLLPLLHCYQHFLYPAPDELSEFCQTLVDAFPHIYDVKRLFYSVKETQMPRCAKFFSSGQSLERLFAFLKSAEFRSHLPNEPEVVCLDQGLSTKTIPNSKKLSNSELVKFHDPGQAAYAAGVAFIKLAHLFTVDKSTQATLSSQALAPVPAPPALVPTKSQLEPGPELDSETFEHWLEAIANSRNKVQWSSLETNYLDLGIIEPILDTDGCNNSVWLCVRGRRYERPLRMEQLQKRLAQIDMEGLSGVKKTAANEALIELDNEQAAEKILQQLRGEREYSIHLYRPPQLPNRWIDQWTDKWTDKWTGTVAVSSTLAVFFIAIFITKKFFKT